MPAFSRVWYDLFQALRKCAAAAQSHFPSTKAPIAAVFAASLLFAPHAALGDGGQPAAEVSAPVTAETPRKQTEARLITATGIHDFTVEIADDPVERAEGLMFRENMARDHGMLFDFADEDFRSFWMKNTPLPLDIIFIKADGTVDSIAHNTTPFSTEGIPSYGPVRFVFEVNAGVADEIGLKPGDRLLHRRIEGFP